MKGTTFSKISTQIGQDKGLIATQLIFVVLNYGIGGIGALFSFDPFCSINLFAVRSCTFQFLGFFLKAIVAPIAAFANYDDIYSQVLLILISFAISLTRAIYLLKDFPFYNYLPMKLARVATSISIWLSVGNILAIIWYKKGWTSSLSLSYLIILTIPLGIKASLEVFRLFVEFYIGANPRSLGSESQIYAKLFVYRFLADKVNLSLNDNRTVDRYEAYFLGDLIDHSKRCQDPKCLCSSVKFSKNQGTYDSVKSTKRSLSTYLGMMSTLFLGEALQRVRHKAPLKVTLAEIIFTNAVHRFSALIYIFQSFSENTGLIAQLKRYVLTKKIQAALTQYYNQADGDRLNIVKFIDYEHDTNAFLTLIASATNEYIDFWDTMKKSKFRMTDLLIKSDKIEHAADKIEKLWNFHNEKHDSFYQEMREPYSIYLSIVRNTPSVSSAEIKKLRWKTKPRSSTEKSAQITENDLASSRILTFYMSMMRERLGRVNYVSENIENCLGYKSQELVGKNINFIMSPIFAETHDQILLKHLEKSKMDSQAKDYYTFTIYVKTRAGYIVPCSIYTTIFPYLQQELEYTGIIKVLTIKFDIMITDVRGYIDSYTEGVGKKLGLSLEKKFNIKEICLDIDKLLNISSQKRPSNNFTYSASGNLMTMESNYTKEDQKEEMQNKSAVLTFVKRSESVKYIKYNMTLTKREIMDKTVYIFQMEPVYDHRQQAKTPKTLLRHVKIEKQLSEIDDSIDDIPIEGIVSEQKMRWKKTLNLNEETPSDSKEDYTDTTPRTQSPIKKQILDRRTGRQSEWTESNYDKKTTSQFMRDSKAYVKIDTSKNLINSIEIDDDNRDQRVKRGSIPSPVNPKQVAFVQSERGSTTSMSSNMNNKLENAIYTIPKDRANYLMKFVVWVLVVICIAMHIIFSKNADTKLNFLNEDVSVMTASTLRFYQITELNKRTRMISLYQYGYIVDGRFLALGINIPIPYIAIMYITYIYPNITMYNNQLRTSIQKIETDLQEELFESTIPVYDPDSKTISSQATIFDAATTLAVEAGALALINPFLIQKNNYQMNFILNNTLNGQLVVSTIVNEALLEDNVIKLDSLRNQSLCFMIILLLLSIILLMMYGYNQYKFIQSRNKFTDLFLRLSDEEIDQNMPQVRAFRNIVQKKGTIFEEELAKAAPSTPKSATLKKRSVKAFRIRKRDADLHGINYRILFGALLFLWIIIVILAPFIDIHMTISSNKEVIRKNVQTIVDANSNLCDMNVLSVAIYEYVQWNATTEIRDNPIGEELEASFTRLAASQSVFTDLLTDNKDDKGDVIDPELETLLSGNLCAALGFDISGCAYFGASTGNGIIGLNTFVLLVISRVKAAFDISSKTLVDGRTALSQPDLITIEAVYTMVQEEIFKKLGDILRVKAEQKIQDLNDSLKRTMIISIICAVVIGVAVAEYIYKLTEKERIRWRKLMRKIPFNVALNNKAFKSYLVRESNHLLDSMKNSI